MKTVALIPARYHAERFPGKLMQKLGDKTVILQTYEATVRTALFHEVCVVTDSDIIYEEIIQNGGRALKSKATHQCGTDRIAEAAIYFPDAKLFVNVQGDEPFTQEEALKNLLQAFEEDANLQVASLMHVIEDEQAIKDPNNVKVVVDEHSHALLFSRSVIPFHRDRAVKPVYYKHIGIYAFRKKMLLAFPDMPQTPLEKAEKLEGLRYLENGIKMKMILADKGVIGIDTPEDLERARKFIS